MAEKPAALEEVNTSVNSMLDVLEAMAPRVAQLQRVYYDALLKAGFNASQALELVSSQPLMSLE